ncbi:MAG: hypothetical protein LBN02_04680 [Oscillospiraceae bacterium]|jgi:hypothetical protein|nr:hypothetical protein [Oscillospiraceae bacterium]
MATKSKNHAKRLLALVLALLMALMPTLATTVYAAGAATVTVGTVSAENVENDTVQVPVTIANSPDLFGLSFIVVYDDTALELTGISFTGSVLPSDGDFSVDVETPSAAGNVMWTMSFDSEDATVPDGLLFTLTFKILGAADDDDYAVSVELTDGDEDSFLEYLGDFDVDTADVNFVAGQVTLTEPVAKDYTVSLEVNKDKANVGDEITVNVIITSDETTYTNTDVYVLYDEDELEYVADSAAWLGASSSGLAQSVTAISGLVYLFRIGDPVATGTVATFKLKVKTTAVTETTEISLGVSTLVNNEAEDTELGDPAEVEIYNLKVTFSSGTGVTSFTDVTAYVRYDAAGLYTTNAYSTQYTAPPTVTAATGYRLADPYVWTGSSEGNKTFAAIQAFAFEADETYTANAIETHTVTFYAQNGDVVDTLTIDDGALITDVPTAPTVANSSFEGWFAVTASTATYVEGTDTLLSDTALEAVTVDGDLAYKAYYIRTALIITLPDEVDDTTISGATATATANEYTASESGDVTFELNTEVGDDLFDIEVTYTVGDGDPEVITPVSGVYKIPNADITDDVVVTVTKTVKGEIEIIRNAQYRGAGDGYMVIVLHVDGSTVKLDTVTFSYQTSLLYWSSEYEGYAYIVPDTIADDAAAKAYVLSQINAVVETTQNEDINYDGNVNGSTAAPKVNSTDAQVVYDLYATTKYSSFAALPVKQRLEADVNGNKNISTADVNTVYAIIVAGL